MHIKKVEWIDKEAKEAILEVVNNRYSLICFSCPLFYNEKDVLLDPLECLDTNNIVLSFVEKYAIEKKEGVFEYKLTGKVVDLKKGIVDVYGFYLHIDEQKIPGDIMNGMYIEFMVSRIDIY